MAFFGWLYVEKEQVLRLLQQLTTFLTPEKWIDWPLALTDKDLVCSPLDPKAVKFCLQGACDYLCAQEYVQPLADCINCAAREYMDELSGNALIHGKLNYDGEMALIHQAIQDIQKEK